MVGFPWQSDRCCFCYFSLKSHWNTVLLFPILVSFIFIYLFSFRKTNRTVRGFFSVVHRFVSSICCVFAFCYCFCFVAAAVFVVISDVLWMCVKRIKHTQASETRKSQLISDEECLLFRICCFLKSPISHRLPVRVPHPHFDKYLHDSQITVNANKNDNNVLWRRERAKKTPLKLV